MRPPLLNRYFALTELREGRHFHTRSLRSENGFLRYPFIHLLNPFVVIFRSLFFVRYHLDEKENLTMILRGGETG